MELFIVLIVVICVCIIVCFSYLLATWIKYIRKQQIEKVKKASKVYYEILKLNIVIVKDVIARENMTG